MTDAELVEASRRGDAFAFGELVDRHRSAVFRTALAACGSRPDAEEVAQDAFIAAWRALAGFRGDAEFKTWLLAITWRRALTRRRSMWLWLKRFGTAVPEHVATAGASDSERRLLDLELADEVESLVRSLPSKLRDPLLLASTGQWTFAQMAVVLGAPEGTLKWRVMVARRRLKQKLAALGYEVK